MNSNTPYDQVYKTLDEIVNQIEAMTKETSANLFQKIVDIIKPKVEPKTEPIEQQPAAAAVKSESETEVIKDDKQV